TSTGKLPVLDGSALTNVAAVTATSATTAGSITGSGVITNANLDSATTYSNITAVGTLGSLTVTGAISGATSTNTINGLVINTSALSNVKGITFVASSAALNVNSNGITNAGTIGGVSGITFNSSTAALNLASNGITNAGTVSGLTYLAVGTGSSTGTYPLDIRSSVGSAIHVSADGTDTGGYFTAFGSNGFYLSGGAALNTAGNAWVAKDTTAGIMNVYGGNYLFFSNSGLTAGGTYSPTQRFEIEGNGKVDLAGGQTGDLKTQDNASGTANTLTIKPGSSGVAGGTGANLLLQGGDQTDAAGTGGSIILSPGAGASTGAVIIRQAAASATTIYDDQAGKVGSLKAGLAKLALQFDNSGNFGIASDTRANILAANAPGTDLLTILGANGNVGINDASPTATLSVGSAHVFTVDGSTGNTSVGGTLTVTGAATVNNNLSVTGTTTTFATLSLNNGHFQVVQTNAPATTTPTSCNTTPTATIGTGATDAAGSVTIHVGTGTGTRTCSEVINFNKAYASTPKSVLITGTTAASMYTVQAFVSAVTTNSFTITFGANGTASTNYTYYYWVIE
ncbi:MAG TPA: hypothetical protein VG604_02150, partial [Candidatus Saccharimonadales bacterium]|nr:hypothetical protein [Candidatus Saccharimonadales bacterium]